MDYGMILEYTAAIVFTTMQGFVFNVVMPLYGIISLFT